MADAKQERVEWEAEYQRGLWSRLQGSQEYARYRLVSGFIQPDAKPIKLLDVGCGEGVILKHLDLGRIEQYTGVDLAQAALDQITPKRPQDRHVRSSVEDYMPADKWDVILFNEVLYYTSDPVSQLKRFEGSLTAGGCFVISMYRKRNPLSWNNRCIRRIQQYLGSAGYSVDHAVELVKLPQRISWVVLVARPRPTG
jgi:trans-aconitate methyltransferase